LLVTGVPVQTAWGMPAFVLNSDITAYNAWAQTCGNNGDGCLLSGLPASAKYGSSGVIYSWGGVAESIKNSEVGWTYVAPAGAKTVQIPIENLAIKLQASGPVPVGGSQLVGNVGAAWNAAKIGASLTPGYSDQGIGIGPMWEFQGEGWKQYKLSEQAIQVWIIPKGDGYGDKIPLLNPGLDVNGNPIPPVYAHPTSSAAPQSFLQTPGATPTNWQNRTGDDTFIPAPPATYSIWDPDLVGTANWDGSAGVPVLNDGDQLVFQFLTTGTANQDRLNRPDAIYAPLAVVLKTGPGMSVATQYPINPGSTPAGGHTLDFGNVRAGTSVVGRVQVSNDDNPLVEVKAKVAAVGPNANFQLAAGSENTEFTIDPLSPVLPQDGVPTRDTQNNDYRYTAGSLGKIDTIGQPHNASVTVDNTNNTGTDVDVTLKGTTVGPIFDMTGTDLLCTAADYCLDFAPTIVGSQVSKTLTLKNLFGIDLDELTDLSILSLSATGDMDQFLWGDPKGVIAASGQRDFEVRFRPDASGIWQLLLTFGTDADAAFGTDGNDLTLRLTGTTTGTAPLPATALLLGVGLLGMLGTRRRLG
jgi:hypothetical protein